MTTRPLRRPRSVGLRLWGALAGLVVVQAILLCLGVRAVFVGEGLDRLVVCGRILAMTAAAVGAQAVAVVEMLRRTAPLYRAARRAASEDVPPSQAALRDALAAPHWLGAVTAGPGVLVGASDLLSGGAVFGAHEPGGGAPLGLFVCSVALAVAVLAGSVARGAVEGWLAAFRPDQQVLHQGRVAVPSIATLSALTVAAVGGVVTALAWAAEPGVVAIAASVVAVAGTVTTWALARRIQARLASDQLTLVARLSEAEAALAGGSAARLTLSEAPWQSAELAELAAALDEMSNRYGALVRQEDLARASVQELQRSKMLFMASMSHDLRSPLNSILGFGELLQQSGERSFNDAQRESVRLIARSGEELLRLLNDVLDSARYEAGRLQLRPAWTPSVEILTEAVRQAREMVADDELEIVAELQPGLPPVHVDRERIVQAVVGLFRHAARAMSGGTIRMYARVAPDPVTGAEQLRVDVVDRSGGIRDEDRERIFEAFREVTSASGRRIGGLGLSLSLARALVRAHGGDVWLDNEPGRGTTFTVAIPVAPAP